MDSVQKSKMMPNDLKKRIADGLKLVGKAMPAGLVKPFVDFVPKFPALAHVLPEGHDFLFRKFLGRFSVLIDVKYGIEKEMLWDCYEPELMSVIRKCVPVGGTVFDIGANVGAITLALADKVGHTGRVYSFEPGPVIFGRLVNNLNLNPALKEVVFPQMLGLSDKEGSLMYYELSHYRGDGVLRPPDGTWEYHESFQVNVTTIDLFVSRQDIRRIDFMKIDVEGMEQAVLRGGLKTISAFRPILYLETLVELGPGNFSGVEGILKPMEYEMFKVDSDRGLLPATAGDFQDNTIAIRRDCSANVTSLFG
jgi:FkbM family methyltransferase